MSDIFKILVNERLTDIAELKVAELKTELKKRGVSTAGNKQELFDKLKAVIIRRTIMINFIFHYIYIYMFISLLNRKV